MQSYLTDINIKNNTEIDAGLKAFITIVLAIVASVCVKQISLLIILLYLVIATFLLGSNFRFILKNIISYGIIFLLPFSFGLLLSIFFGFLFSNNLFFSDYVLKETVLRIVRIFFIWYIGSLYFCTTPLKSILGMLRKVLYPLNILGVPVLKYLNIVMCIIIELTQSVNEFKNKIIEQSRDIFRDNSLCFKTKIKELSNILVLFITNSLQKTEEIQKLVEQTNTNDFIYSFKVSRNEILAIFSLIILLTVLIFLERVNSFS
ncbi:MAG: energy-coupling factor transporter transmembrane component T family protein [Desulfitobacteriaceae bacterium]